MTFRSAHILRPGLRISLPGYYKDVEIIGQDERLYFWKGDFRNFLFKFRENPRFVQETYGLDFERFSDVFHFAAIVGGTAEDRWRPDGRCP
ncbi:MAG: hypothetical protein MZV63_36620 [Marinilabiliales bacterium]|nr:hypothetical protein [Marinilabiliales bacterium]